MSYLRWLSQRKLELSIFFIGVLLRLTMVWNYRVNWSYDSDLHWEVVEWIAKHGRVPHPESTFESFHPPLYYAFAALLKNHGVTREHMVYLPIAAGTLRLAVIWAGLELYVKHSRFARVIALILAAVVSASVHIDGMVYPEALSCFWNAFAMLLVPLVFRKVAAARWPLALFVGLILGAAMLTKISGAAVILAIGLAVGCEFLLLRRTVRERVLSAMPWAMTFVVALSVCGWYYARNVREYGKPFVTSFDLPSQHWLVTDVDNKPIADRRTLGYVFSWDKTIYAYPFAISNVGAHPRFFPVAVASTFVDFWQYGFQGFELPYRRPARDDRRPSVLKFVNVGRLAVIGGTAIFLATLLAWFAAFRRVLRDRDFGRLALVLIPLVATLASLHFSTESPVDSYGVVKGIYMTFGAPPLYALFGIAAGWSLSARERWPILAVLMISLWMVAAYTFKSRLGISLLPV